MKLFSINDPNREGLLKAREQALDESIRGLHTDLDIEANDVISTFYLEEKLEHHQTLESLFRLLKFRDEMFSTDEILPVKKETFHPFLRLPLELRQMIWGYSCLDCIKPRIHTIDNKTSSNGNEYLTSNQPISPLLHTCRESRKYFVFITKSTAAFCSYINFDTDMIYIRCHNHQGREGSRPIKSWFIRFLKNESTHKIRHLAFSSCLYETLSFGSPENSPIRTYCVPLAEHLPQCREITFVFDDDRPSDEAWKALSTSFAVIPARQKRKLGHLKLFTKLSTKFLRERSLEPFKYRAVSLDHSDAEQEAARIGMITAMDSSILKHEADLRFDFRRSDYYARGGRQDSEFCWPACMAFASTNGGKFGALMGIGNIP